MEDIEVLISKVFERHPEWREEAEELGADQHLSSLVQFLIWKIEQMFESAPGQIVVTEVC